MCLIKAILMNTYKIHFQYKKKITLNYPKSAAIFFNKKVCCVFSLESNYNSNDYTQYTIFNTCI